jgi:hypothetical protein
LADQIPYFDTANAIIFVAPVSAFDQVRLVRVNFGTLTDLRTVSRRRPANE